MGRGGKKRGRGKRGVTTAARHKKVITMAAGYRGRAKNCYRTAIQRVEKGLQYAYRDRKVRKREFRSLWIRRINAGARLNGLTYSELMNGIKQAGIELDRKVLADIAARDPAAFAKIVDRARAALAKAA